jgi:hypothetical protein
MIIVIGLPAYTDENGEHCAGGLAVEIAADASHRGSKVELAGKVGSDGPGDSVVVALGQMGVGHAALLRDPTRPTPLLVGTAPDDSVAAIAAPVGDRPVSEPLEADLQDVRLLPEDPSARPELEAGDIQMALRYLTGPSVVVVAESLAASSLAAAVDGAAFSGAKLIVLAEADSGSLAAIPESATVLERPVTDDGSFARLVGAFAASLDAGNDPARAFREGVAASGWEPAGD